MSARAAVATTTSIATITSVATATAVTLTFARRAAGFSAGAEIAEFTGDLAVERVLETHRHRTARTTLARRTTRVAVGRTVGRVTR